MKRGQHKLSDRQVIEIYLDGRSNKEVAKIHRCSANMVSAIKNGLRYRNITQVRDQGLESQVAGMITEISEGNSMFVARQVISLVIEDCRRRLG